MSGAPPGSTLVTGAGLRVGRAIALDLARHGWAVAVHYHRSAEAAREVVAAITGAGGTAVAIDADLADEAAAAELVARAVSALGPLSLLVNNAALFENDRVDSVTRESWDAHIGVNLRAPLVLTQGFARQLPDGADGNVVNLLDQLVWNLGAGFVSYTVSKSGLWSLTRSLALALAPRIRVNGIGPGPALPSRRQSDAQFAAHAAALPLGRGTTPAEVCDALRFILAAPAMTGQMIALDGGEHLEGPEPRKPATPPAARPAGEDAAPTRPAGTRRIFVRDLILEGRIGIHRHERDATQRLRINVDLTLADAGPLDEKIANTVSYDDIVAGVKAIVDAGHVKLVETLADRIGDFCTADDRVAAARVRVEKLDAFADATSVGVEIERLNTRL